MKLFQGFEAVRFSEENLILITRNGYLYYIYSPKHKWWQKHTNAGDDHLTVCNYEEISEGELAAALGGCLPERESDFMRQCYPNQLNIGDMLSLLAEDYPTIMSDFVLYHATHSFLNKSVILHQSYKKLRTLFDAALTDNLNHERVLLQLKDLCCTVIGRDIFKPEIGIINGHDGSSYFRIMPVRVIDDTDTNSNDCVAMMKSAVISIEESDIEHFLAPFLQKHFDANLEANQNRRNGFGFEWYITNNFYTYDSIANIVKDISDTINALMSGDNNEYTAEIKEKWESAICQPPDMSSNQIKNHSDNRPAKDINEIELITDFYRRFIYRMEYMMKTGKEYGFNLISFMGP